MKISKLKRGDIISVTWIDSMATGRWYNEEEVNSWEKEDETCHSVGFLFKVSKRLIILYQNSSPTEYGNLTSIPRKIIIKIKLLKK